MKNDNITIYNIIPIGPLLGLIFIVLKLTNIINWSWIWVLSPFWIPLVILMCLCTIVILCCTAKLK